jgi:hypothetical protein
MDLGKALALGVRRHGIELGARHVLQRGVDFRTIQAFSKDSDCRSRSLKRAMDFAEPRSTPMSDRLAESSPSTASDILELALYSTAVLFVVLLWEYVPA